MEGSDFNKLFTDIIQKQITILGPDVTLSTVRQIPGILVDDKGVVTQLDGEPHKLLERLIQEFVSISSDIVRETIEPILADYPTVQSTLKTSQDATLPQQPSQFQMNAIDTASMPTTDKPPQPQVPSQQPSLNTTPSAGLPLTESLPSTQTSAQNQTSTATQQEPGETQDPQLQQINQMFNQAPAQQSAAPTIPTSPQTQPPATTMPSTEDPTKTQ